MPLWMQALSWGLVGGLALVVGAGVGVALKVPTAVVAGVMAFGAGVLVSALSLELMADAAQRAGLVPAAIGFAIGAVTYLAANLALARRGAQHRKRSGQQQSNESETPGSGAAIAVGALLDGIPESVVIGVSLLGGGSVSVATVTAVFISNVPEGLSSAAGMRAAGRTRRWILTMWAGITVVCGLASLGGYVAVAQLPAEVIAATTAVAAGAILTMVADTMIPEAFSGTARWSGLLTAAGYLVSFGLSAAGS